MQATITKGGTIINSRNSYDSGRKPSPVAPSEREVYISGDECDVHVGVLVNRLQNVVVWGHVVDCRNMPVKNVPVKLYRYVSDCRTRLEEVAQTRTDCKGYYQFELRDICPGRYRVVVGKCAREPGYSPGKGDGYCDSGCHCGHCDYEQPEYPECCSVPDRYSGEPHYPASSCKTTVCSSVRYQ